MPYLPGSPLHRRQQFTRVLGLTFLSTLLPGIGLFFTHAKRAAWAAATVLVAAAAGLTWLVLTHDGLVDLAADLASSQTTLAALAVGLPLAGAGWAALVAGTAKAAWPWEPTTTQKVLAFTLTLTLCATVMTPAVMGSRYALAAHQAAAAVFAAAPPPPTPATPAGHHHAQPPRPVEPADPFAGLDRVNVLLLGSDAGPNRTGVRTDSVMVVSIDTTTGDTTLLALPRNLQNVPFPTSSPLHQVWPEGYNCGRECLLNAVWGEAEAHAHLFGGDPNPGLTATRSVVEEILGLDVQYTATITFAAFAGLVDAVGGVTVTVKDRLPIGGKLGAGGEVLEQPRGWIEPGTHHLDGYHAQWYTRSRFASDDYDRMRRQRCMVAALTDQLDPATIVARFPQLASVAGENLRIDIPQSQLPAWVDLARKVKAGTMTSLPFTTEVISPADPDFEAIRAMVDQALNPPRKQTSPAHGHGNTARTATPADQSTPTRRGDTGQGRAVTDATGQGPAQEVGAVC
jgi:LCP family protein required for cell wall assembly